MGGLYDVDTKLVKFGVRSYDPEVGRWLQKEPLGFKGALNFYSYCSGEPVGFVDLDGRKEQPIQTVQPTPPTPEVMNKIDGVAIDIMRQIHCESYCRDNEYCAYIFKTNRGQIRGSIPGNISKEDQSWNCKAPNPDLSEGINGDWIFWVHAHGAPSKGAEEFSNADRDIPQNFLDRLPFNYAGIYLVTPEGLMWRLNLDETIDFLGEIGNCSCEGGSS